ncbi:hypothetical protein GCM10028857_26590 [Salinarchaeum chitinilyticum]
MTADRVRRLLQTDRLARFLRTDRVRAELQPDRLRRRIRANPWLTVVLIAAAILLYFGIWRVEPHQLIPDESGAVGQPFTLLQGRPGLTSFEKGGNLHIWLLTLAYLPVLVVVGAYWLVTGQIGENVENVQEVAKYQDGTQWDVANPAVVDAFSALVTAGRFVSATAGLLAILGVALLARRLYDRPAGVLAGATLAVSLGFTLTAKYATEDVLAGCLFVWTLYPLAVHHDTGEDRPLLLAALVAGLAMSAKATTGILALPIAYYALRRYELGELTSWPAIREIARYPAAAIAAYVATTPSLLINPDLYVAELARYGSVRAGEAAYYAHPDPGYLAHAGHLATALGAPLFALALVGTVAAVALTATGRLGRFTAVPLALAVLYYAIIASWGNIQYNRALLLLPLLALFVGLAAGWAIDAERRPSVRRVAGPIVAIVLLLSLFYTASGAVAWSTSRAEATEWTHDNLDDGDAVTTLGQRTYLPEFPEGVNVSRTVIDPIYDADNATAKQRAIARVECNRPERLVLTSFHYERYFEDSSVAPNVTALYESLLAEEDYEIVASFGPPNPNLRGDAAERFERALALEPPARNTNNPRILVMERTGEPVADCPGLED